MCGYHIRADAAGIHVSGGRDGLYGRYVLSWWLSNTLDTAFCLDALQAALRLARPGIFNTDQGVQFTSGDFTGELEIAGVLINMDGRVVSLTIFLSSGCGGRLSTRTSIPMPMRPCPSWRLA
ncbi:MAG: hypothetical protein KC449_10740 [Anaerolineales bacterium]|nr:hypothetical protein [Anaerolineales bacterium]